MNTQNNFRNVVQIDGTIFKKRVYDITHNGQCQCFKDCNCRDQKGKIMGVLELFYHPLSTKAFRSLESCTQSFNAARLTNKTK